MDARLAINAVVVDVMDVVVTDDRADDLVDQDAVACDVGERVGVAGRLVLLLLLRRVAGVLRRRPGVAHAAAVADLGVADRVAARREVHAVARVGEVDAVPMGGAELVAHDRACQGVPHSA